MSAVKGTLYIKGNASVEVTRPEVSLGDLVQMTCADPSILPRLKAMHILKFQDADRRYSYHGRSRTVVSVLRIIQCIQEQYPALTVENLGAQDIIISYENQKTSGKWVHGLKIAVVTAISFVGSAFSIMAFNNDVDTSRLFAQIYEWLTGTKSSGFTALEISYSIGISIGILVFFNHFGRKRFSIDPTPMEVEMRLYENDIQTTLVENYSRKGKEVDVGTTNVVRDHRP